MGYPSDLPLYGAIMEMREVTSERDAQLVLGRALSRYRVQQYALHFSVSPTPQAEKTSIEVISSYDSLWLNHYQQSGFMAADPVATRALDADTPFDWRELRYGPSDLAARVMEQARPYDIAHGYSLPLTSGRGFVCLSLCFGRDPNQELSSSAIAALSLALPHLRNEAIHLLLRLGRISPLLTSRQRQVLRMVGKGLSSSQIAAILDVQKSTVDAHLREISRRLDARGRSAVLRKAQLLGELNLDRYMGS
jgi:DNA-binding CsgD family transcriptional regulator